MSPSDNDPFGPIDFFVVEFPDGQPSEVGFTALLALVDAGTIRVIDLELVQRSGNTVTRVDAGSFNAESVSAFAGAESGLLDDDDLAQLAEDLTDGALAAVVVYEELAILSALDAWEAEGGHVVSEGHLSVVELVEALDATESA